MDPVRRDLNMPAERELSYTSSVVLCSCRIGSTIHMDWCFYNDAIYRKAYVVPKEIPVSFKQ